MLLVSALLGFFVGAMFGYCISALLGSAHDDAPSRLRQDYERERSRQPWQT